MTQKNCSIRYFPSTQSFLLLLPDYRWTQSTSTWGPCAHKTTHLTSVYPPHCAKLVQLAFVIWHTAFSFVLCTICFHVTYLPRTKTSFSGTGNHPPPFQQTQACFKCEKKPEKVSWKQGRDAQLYNCKLVVPQNRINRNKRGFSPA